MTDRAPLRASNLHIVYVIAAYNEAKAIGSVIEDLKRNAPAGEIVVVDDGSADETSASAKAGGAIVARHLINRGQGAALQTGLDCALRLGADVAVTFDADGQHRASDVSRFVERIIEEDVDVVLGSRFLDATSNVPRVRRLVLRAAVFFTRTVSRLAVTDAHNGFRAFRATALSRLRITEDRMAHASELLDLIALARLKWVEVPTTVTYSEYSMSKGQRSSAAVRVAVDFLIGKLLR